MSNSTDTLAPLVTASRRVYYLNVVKGSVEVATGGPTDEQNKPSKVIRSYTGNPSVDVRSPEGEILRRTSFSQESFDRNIHGMSPSVYAMFTALVDVLGDPEVASKLAPILASQITGDLEEYPFTREDLVRKAQAEATHLSPYVAARAPWWGVDVVGGRNQDGSSRVVLACNGDVDEDLARAPGGAVLWGIPSNIPSVLSTKIIRAVTGLPEEIAKEFREHRAAFAETFISPLDSHEPFIQPLSPMVAWMQTNIPSTAQTIATRSAMLLDPGTDLGPLPND